MSKDVYKFYSWFPSFMDESSEKKECPILSVILENWGVYSPLSALFDIVSSFVAGELADWSVYLFLVTPHSVHWETSVFKAYFLGSNNRYLCPRTHMKEFENSIIIFTPSPIQSFVSTKER